MRRVMLFILFPEIFLVSQRTPCNIPKMQSPQIMLAQNIDTVQERVDTNIPSIPRSDFICVIPELSRYM